MNYDAHFSDATMGLQVAQQQVQQVGGMDLCLLDEALLRHAVALPGYC